jgi:PhzF family phenazine biosynthesis protein
MIDVFGSGPFTGNPVAVVLDAAGVDTDEMMEITKWLNLSETTFLLPPTNPEADYRVRIFTLRGELPFAGHPTLGTCHAWLGSGGIPRGEMIIQECGIGLVPLRNRDRLSFAAPPLIRSGAVDEAFIADVAMVLGIERAVIVDAAWVDNGPGWVGILLADHESVLALEPDVSRHRGSGHLDIGVIGPHRDGSDVAFEVRAFFSDDKRKLVEDPVTGSLNASLAQWLTTSGRAPDTYVAAQGTAIGRAGRIYIQRDRSGVWVGGDTVTHISGAISRGASIR